MAALLPLVQGCHVVGVLFASGANYGFFGCRHAPLDKQWQFIHFVVSAEPLVAAGTHLALLPAFPSLPLFLFRKKYPYLLLFVFTAHTQRWRD